MSNTSKNPTEAAIDRLAGGDQKSQKVLRNAAKHFNKPEATLGFVRVVEDLGLRRRAIGEFHAIACSGNDHLFRMVMINESTGVTTFGVRQHDTTAKLRALAEVLKHDETTQKMVRFIG